MAACAALSFTTAYNPPPGVTEEAHAPEPRKFKKLVERTAPRTTLDERP